MKVEIEKLKKSAVKISITVPNSKVVSSYDEVLKEKAKVTKIEGFREGNAPKKMVEEKLGPSKIYGDVINKIIQDSYVQAISEHKIKPYSNPKVEIKEFDLKKDFEYIAEVAVEPTVKVANKDVVKKELKKLLDERNENLKKENDEKTKKGEKVEIDHAHLHSTDVIKVLVENSDLEVADVLVQEEANRMLNQLSSQVKQIGMKFEDYLKAQNTTIQDLQKTYNESAENNLKAEFILNTMIKEDDIKIEDSEIDSAFDASGVSGVEQRKQDPTERAYVKSILQKNKLITNLLEEVQGVHNHE